MRNRTRHNITRHEPKRWRPQPDKLGPKTSGEQAQNQTKPTQLHVKSLWAKSRGSQEATQRSWANLDQAMVRPHPLVWPHPHLLRSAQALVGCLLPPLQRWLHGYHGGINEENGGLINLWKESKHIPWDYSSSPCIKGGHPLLIQQQHTRREHQRASRSRTYLSLDPITIWIILYHFQLYPCIVLGQTS